MAPARFCPRQTLILPALVTLVSAGCATVNVPHIGAEGYRVEEDEQRMFKRAEELIELVDDSDLIYDGPELERYLTGLAQNLLTDDLTCDEVAIRVRVLNDPAFNAFALPNGRIFVNLGILAAADNEAQIASLLGHEMTHVLHRHQLMQFRSITNKSAFFATIAMPVGVFGGVAGSLATQLAAVSSLYGYSQHQENEADEGAFRMTLAKGYDVREGKKMFENMKRFLDNEEIKQPFFFSTHPAVQARINSYEEFIEQQAGADHTGRIVTTPDFERLIGPVLLAQIRICLRDGFFKTAHAAVDRFIARAPDDAEGYFYRGELYRQRQDHAKKEKARDKTEDYTAALAAYDKAAMIDPGLAEAFKGKARVLAVQEKPEEAKENFRKYLELRPDAPDRAYVEQYLK